MHGRLRKADRDRNRRQVKQHLVKQRTLLRSPVDLHQGGANPDRHGLKRSQLRHTGQDKKEADGQRACYARQ